MNEQELIEKLKHNTCKFCDCSINERIIFKEAGRLNCLFFDFDTMEWVKAEGTLNDFNDISFYRLAPDYSPKPPKPEYEDYEVQQVKSNNLGIYIYYGTDRLPIPLWEIPAMPNFKEFWRTGTSYNDGSYEVGVGYAEIATRIHEGNKVYARFRR